jgi:hypothetical protein
MRFPATQVITKLNAAIWKSKNQQAELFSINQWLERLGTRNRANAFKMVIFPVLVNIYNVNTNTYLPSAKQQTTQKAMNRVQNNNHHIRMSIWLLPLQATRGMAVPDRLIKCYFGIFLKLCIALFSGSVRQWFSGCLRGTCEMTPRGFQTVTFSVALCRRCSTARKSVHFSIFSASFRSCSFVCLLLPRNTLPSLPYGQTLTPTTVSSIISCVLASAFECSETECVDGSIKSAFINIFRNL